ncbi:MAG: acetyl-CoA decarbonylase/synthase complex subunit alpha/beta [Actinomycetota bacterium]
MSKIIASSAIRGAHKIVEKADQAYAKALQAKGEGEPVAFPDTAYYLPVIYALTGVKVATLGDLLPIMEKIKELLPEVPTARVWLPYLGNTLDAGIATLMAEEIIEALKYVIGPNPVEGIWLGATDDVIVRTQGIKLVDGSMPGFAACVGATPTTEEAVKLATDLRERNILVFMSGETNGKTMAEQLAEAEVQMGWDVYLVPFGRDIYSAVYALGVAARSAMTFGGITPGGLKEARDILLYNKNRVFAFVLALGEVDEEKYATAAGAINFGFPVIADTDIPQILPTGIATYEHVVSNIPLDKIVDTAIEVRGVKIKITKVPIPVSYGPAFEGERIRKEAMFVEFGGQKSASFEFLRMRDMDDIENGKIEVIGPDVDSMEESKAYPLGILVEVAGRKMQSDFEPVLERQMHHMINGAEGIWHMGQRDMNWMRISKGARNKGFKIKHFGELLKAKLMDDFPAIVDKTQITLFTDETKMKDILENARTAFKVRDERVAGLVDESVETFYSCTLCQSFAPNHVCVISPERLGLCGAYNWLDAKAAHEINPTGANQPITKGEAVDEKMGQWIGVNETVKQKSSGNVERVNAYSIMVDPETSCGCFECIVAILPMANGVMIVNREFTAETPVGMKFSTLAGSVGGGAQTPGFLGVGRQYITSGKFIAAEGGFKRIVWMPKELKEALLTNLKKRAEAIGLPDFVDKIADESIATTEEEVMNHMAQVGHPALEMESLIG